MNLSGFSEPVLFALDRQDVFNDYDIEGLCAVYVIIKDNNEIVKIGEGGDLDDRFNKYLNTNRSEEGPKKSTRRRIRNELRNNPNSNYSVRWKEQSNKAECEKFEQIMFDRFEEENDCLPKLNPIRK